MGHAAAGRRAAAVGHPAALIGHAAGRATAVGHAVTRLRGGGNGNGRKR